MRAFLPCLMALAGWLASGDAQARDLAVAETDLLNAEIMAIRTSPGADMAAVLLKVEDETLTIFIGIVEAMAIERARRGVQSPRPLTHDLLGDVIVSADLRMRRLVIDELTDDGNYLAALELQPVSGGATRRIDSRPSDGMVLAQRSGARIVVARQVVEKARAAEQGEPPDPPRRASGVSPIQT